jgi:hypothetical protein
VVLSSAQGQLYILPSVKYVGRICYSGINININIGTNIRAQSTTAKVQDVSIDSITLVLEKVFGPKRE